MPTIRWITIIISVKMLSHISRHTNPDTPQDDIWVAYILIIGGVSFIWWITKRIERQRHIS